MRFWSKSDAPPSEFPGPSGRPLPGDSGPPGPSTTRAGDAGGDLPEAGIGRLGAVPSLPGFFRSGTGKSGLLCALVGAGDGGFSPAAPLAADEFAPVRKRFAAVGVSAPIPFAGPEPG